MILEMKSIIPFEKPKRILHIVSAMNRGGAETMIMNLYRNVDRKAIQFDFVSHLGVENDFEQEILSMGGVVYKIGSLGTTGFLKYFKSLKKVIKTGGFEIVHAHNDIQMGIVLFIALLSGVKLRIAHAHSTKWDTDDKKNNSLFYKGLRLALNVFSNKKVACGVDAAKFMFSKKFLGDIFFLNNGIEIEKFSNINPEIIQGIKNEFNISSELVIGHIGRFDLAKNQSFLIEIARILRNKNFEFKMLLVGEGALREELEEKVTILNLNKFVFFLRVREDINVLMNTFDLFVFPSVFEGLPVTLIEAQAAGTKILMSDNITDEAIIYKDLVIKLYLDNIEAWVEKIINSKKRSDSESFDVSLLVEKGYSAKANVGKLYQIYNIDLTGGV